MPQRPLRPITSDALAAYISSHRSAWRDGVGAGPSGPSPPVRQPTCLLPCGQEVHDLLTHLEPHSGARALPYPSERHTLLAGHDSLCGQIVQDSLSVSPTTRRLTRGARALGPCAGACI